MVSPPDTHLCLAVIGCCVCSYGHAYSAEVYLAEVPSQLIIRDSWMDAERDNISQVVVKVDPSINLDGPCVQPPLPY
jgi:hypothetical protein